jgi:proline-rich protein PRCC
VPPAPTPDDPYPGYYQLPGGEWAAYEPEFYHSFFSSGVEGAEEDEDGGRIGKHWADFDQSAELQDVQASEGMGEAKEAEARRQAAKPKRSQDDFEYKVSS